MPSSITKFKIFLASPNDLQSERELIDEVIQELNLTFGRQKNVILELIKWETHSAPGISNEHPQQIITSDLGQDYDLFIGLLWKSFGSPTDKADSGTEEEFLGAYQKYQKDEKSMQILFYFKNKEVSPLDLVPEDLRKIKNFKTELGSNKKTLYWEYKESSELMKFLRIHVPLRISELLEDHQEQIKVSKTPTDLQKMDNNEIIEDELGFVDYLDLVEENFEDARLSLEKIGESTIWVGEQLKTKTSEINALTLNGNQPSRKDLKDIFKRTAKILDNFGNRIKPEIPIYKENFEKGVEAFSRLVNITANDLNIDEDEAQETKDSLKYLVEEICSGIESMKEFLQAINNLPRMSKDLNKSKFRVAEILGDFLESMTVGHSIACELLNSVEEQYKI